MFDYTVLSWCPVCADLSWKVHLINNVVIGQNSAQWAPQLGYRRTEDVKNSNSFKIASFCLLKALGALKNWIFILGILVFCMCWSLMNTQNAAHWVLPISQSRNKGVKNFYNDILMPTMFDFTVLGWCPACSDLSWKVHLIDNVVIDQNAAQLALWIGQNWTEDTENFNDISPIVRINWPQGPTLRDWILLPAY